MYTLELVTSRAQVLTDRRIAQTLANDLGLRVERTNRRNGTDLLYLWPEDGYAWELADPITASNWQAMRTLLTAMHLNQTLSRRAA